MGRYRGIETQELREKLIRQGLGQGKGSSYQPWIKIGSFPNKGESFSVWCDKTRRDHHYFSTLEYRLHLIAELSPYVVDIREQFPLHPIEETIYIANEQGIEHPNFGGEYCSITIDLLLTIDDGRIKKHLARSAKYRKNILDRRTLEKLQLERLACSSRKIPWELFTEAELPRTIEKNLRWLRGWKRIERPSPTSEECFKFIDVFSHEDLTKNIGMILTRVARKLRVTRELSIYYFRYAAWNQLIEVDLYTPIQLTKPHIALLKNQQYGDRAA